jgi:membrane protein
MVWRHAGASDVNGLAAELAFRSFLAFVPFFVVIVTFAGFWTARASLENPVEQAFNLLGESLSPEVVGAVRGVLDAILSSRPGGLLGAAVVATVVLGASAGASVLKGINRAYDLDETRSWWKRWLLGLAIALLAEGVLCVSLALLVGAQIVGHLAAASGEAPGTFWLVASASRWPLAMLVLLLQGALVYRIAPCGDIPWRWVTPGAAVFTAGWIGASAVFNVYADLVGAYTAVFGILGGIVVLLVWFQITAYALLLGAELNAVLTQLGGSKEAVGLIAHR